MKQILLDCCNDVVFVYNGKKSGITAEVKDYIPTYYVWHGSLEKDYSNVDDLMSDKFFSGKSIDDLIDIVKWEIL